MTKELGKFLTASSSDEVELIALVEDSGGAEAMYVRVVGEVVTESMDGEDDASPALREAGLLAQPVLQGVGDEVAEFSEALGFFTEDVAQNSGDSKNPMAMWDGQANFVADMSCGIEGATLVAARAAAAPLAGKGKQVMVVAVGALDAEEAAGQIAAAQAVAQGGFAGEVEWPKVFGAIRVIACGERFERIVQALPER